MGSLPNPFDVADFKDIKGLPSTPSVRVMHALFATWLTTGYAGWLVTGLDHDK